MKPAFPTRSRHFLLAAALGVLLPALPPVARATPWAMQPGSTLGFSTTFEGVAFHGAFRRFTATIAFDPAHPADCRLDASIALASAETGNADRDKMLPTADFFDVAHFPQARYSGGHCVAGANGSYRAQGTLTLRGISKPVALLLHFQPQGTQALLTLDAEVPRLAFDVGSGQWASPGAIGTEVAVHGELRLARVH